MSTILEMQINELQEELNVIKALNQKLQLEKNAFKEQLTLHNVSQRYTIEDIERCVENWGLCKVEKEYIEIFLNDA